MLKKLKLLKKPLFQKRRWSCDFPPRKDGFLCPRRVVLGLPSPSHRVCGRTDVRMYGCTDVRTDAHVTITSQPKVLGLIGYHISLAMELRWRALPAGSAINNFFLLFFYFDCLYFSFLFHFLFFSKTNIFYYDNAGPP